MGDLYIWQILKIQGFYTNKSLHFIDKLIDLLRWISWLYEMSLTDRLRSCFITGFHFLIINWKLHAELVGKMEPLPIFNFLIQYNTLLCQAFQPETILNVLIQLAAYALPCSSVFSNNRKSCMNLLKECVYTLFIEELHITSCIS